MTWSGPASSDNLPDLTRRYLRSVDQISARFSGALRKQLENLEADNYTKDEPGRFTGMVIEDATEEKKESEAFIPLGYEIALVRSYSDLKKIISQKLDALLQIRNYIVGVTNDDGHTWRLLFIEPKFDVTSGGNPPEGCSYEINDGLFDAMLYADSCSIYDVNQASKRSSVPAYVAVLSEIGIDHAIAFPLRAGAENLGLVLLKPFSKTCLQTEELKIARELSSQIAIALSHLRASEERQVAEAQNGRLMAINTALAAARNAVELGKIIGNQIANFLGFAHHCIVKIDEDTRLLIPYLNAPGFCGNIEGTNRDLSADKFEFSGNLMSKVLLSAEPVNFELNDLIAQGNTPKYIRDNYEQGLRHLVIARLADQERMFGYWMVFFDKKDEADHAKFSLIGSLSNQIGMAIFHISINQEILDKEREKTRLLEFSNALASVREKELLSVVLRTQLKELFGIDDYIVHALNEDKKSFTPLLFAQDAVFADQPEFIKQLDIQNDVYDGIFDVTLASKEPVIHNMEEIALRKNAPAYITAAKAVQLRKMVGVTLRIGEESIAIMNFRLEDVNQIHLNGNLFKSICSQLAIAVENIIANEKVIKQLAEIDRYKQQLEEERIYLKEEILTNQHYGEIVGESSAMQETFRLVTQVAPSDSTVLILGETGTGKELIARAIHNHSPRKDKLLVKVNCAALPANLIESELFGHERGSFTGATDRRIGKFELADKGTLFLDEIGEMPPELQVKLLRALQEKEIERIGGRNVIKVDVRIIAATNRDLEKEMEEGRFRSDLYYRLNIFPIRLAPLRERPQDIPLLAAHFLSRYAKKTAKSINKLSSKVLQELSRYSWPGNIRELEHLMERSVLLSQGDVLRHIDLPKDKTSVSTQAAGDRVPIKTIDENERDHVLQVLKHCNGRVAGEGGAAQLLGVPASTLNSKIKKLGIRRAHLV
ncbi:sigma 54-interacting transcriptional regulator [Pedobacter panaciterrae]|uniref:sigma 54-interacting transcriptional regulator n=1 Tax=Pedobacter panaciterrae TaxID=363849 RepID=UPI0025925CA8|nr:sigma 54-interacting transcriptional regulator [uncultured Pedobacter sp.]